MQTATVAAVASAALSLAKFDGRTPMFRVDGPDGLAVNAGASVIFGDVVAEFVDGAPVKMPDLMVVGADYEIVLNPDMTLSAHTFGAAVEFARPVIGGFHYAPGGNGLARAGGDAVPAINPYSIYDLNFRPACADPRGMTLVGGRFWCDIYLLGVNHERDGTSRHGVGIADGDSLDRLNYADAVAIMDRHGKGLLGVTEFFEAAYGVTEKASLGGKPETTGIDGGGERFTSKWGLCQATGAMWVWGHDDDPDEPRASLFGGSWLNGSYAGSRYAFLGCWPGHSNGDVGARGRSDHLNHDL